MWVLIVFLVVACAILLQPNKLAKKVQVDVANREITFLRRFSITNEGITLRIVKTLYQGSFWKWPYSRKLNLFQPVFYRDYFYFAPRITVFVVEKANGSTGIIMLRGERGSLTGRLHSTDY